MNVIVVHGSNVNDKENIKKYNLPPQNERGWLGWIKEELEGKGIKCFNPLMTDNWAPKYSEWKEEFEKLEVNENTIEINLIAPKSNIPGDNSINADIARNIPYRIINITEKPIDRVFHFSSSIL